MPHDQGCQLILTHEGVLPGYARQTEGGWTTIPDGLAATLRDDDGPGGLGAGE